MDVDPGWLYPTVQEEIERPFFGRPHVVILGAGASVAAFPDGDANGKKLPVMNDIVRTLDLERLFESRGIDYQGRNFEELYSFLAETGNDVTQLLEQCVQEYFDTLAMPPPPTIYDHLVLSLREKDLIATFNWDPFLYYACWRNCKRTRLPHVIYLHGNVSVGFCSRDFTKGLKGTNCSKCKEPFSPSRLLFPVRQKNYTNDPFIKVEWDYLKWSLNNAFMLTIFGYGAPDTDVEAIEIMKQAWGTAEQRDLEEIEFIDIKPAEELHETWKGFIHPGHSRTVADFYDSWIAKHPRRTCEAMWNGLMECRFVPDNTIQRTMEFGELWDWYQPLLDAEAKPKQSS